jgi:hypothetical protein
METAKVDIRKLQLLNDRINQCLDALSQVRLSVHGLSHTQAASPLGTGAQGTGYGDPRFADPRFGFGASPIASGFGGGPQSAGWIGPGFAGGLAHSPFVQNPAFLQNPAFAQNPMAGFSPGLSGIANVPFGNQFPIWNSPIGLSHTGLEGEAGYGRPLWSDPFLQAKVAQTFPYVQFPMTPIVPAY